MITAQPETWGSFLPELREIIGQHYEELALNKDVIPLVPRWDQYEARDMSGSLMLIVARDAGRPVGYFIGFLAHHMHYATSYNLLCDIFYIRPEFRNGWAGVRLFRAMETEARRRGVQRIVVTSKLHLPADGLLRFMKFEPIETVYSKMIEGK